MKRIYGKETEKNDGVLALAQQSLRDNTLSFSEHAIIRMKERKISPYDVEETITTGWREQRKDQFDDQYGEWAYAIRGIIDEKSREIRIVITIQPNGILLVTAIDLTKEEKKK